MIRRECASAATRRADCKTFTRAASGAYENAERRVPQPVMKETSMAAESSTGIRAASDVRRDRALSVTLVIAVLAIFVLRPLAEMHVVANGIAQFAQLALGLIAAFFVADAGPARTTVVAVGLLAVATNALRLVVPGGIVPALALINFGYAIAISWIILVAVFGPGRVTVHRIQGAIVLYLDVALMFAQVFEEIQLFFPAAFSVDHPAFSTLLYFSLSTLTSTTFGDVLPLHPLARSAANLEGVIGQMFPATLLARLVGLHLFHAVEQRDATISSDRRPTPEDAPE
jgi:hypothetical protein